MVREEVVYLNKIIEFVSGIGIRLSEAQLEHPRHGTGIQEILRLFKRVKKYVASIEPKAMMRRYGRYLKGEKRWRSFIGTARQREMDFTVMGKKV